MKKFATSVLALLAGAFICSVSAQDEIPVQGIGAKIIGRVVSFADYETSKMKIIGERSSLTILGFEFGKSVMTNRYTITGPEGTAEVYSQEDRARFQEVATAAVLGIKPKNDYTFGCTIKDPEGNEWGLTLATMPNKADRECGVLDGPSHITIVGDNDTKPMYLAAKWNFHYTFQIDGVDVCTIKSADKVKTIVLSDNLSGNQRLVVAAAASAILARIGVSLSE